MVSYRFTSFLTTSDGRSRYYRERNGNGAKLKEKNKAIYFKRYPKGYVEQNLQMDFFNYAGLHRDVMLYFKPKLNIQDVKILTSFDPDSNRG
jgi:beta-galactosidase/beta-glucuronidase